jgi:hypothetical protein
MRNYEVLSVVLNNKKSEEDFDYTRKESEYIDYTFKSLESLSYKLEVLCKFKEDKADFYLGLENDENKPNIFVRVWRKFVEIIKKIFGAIINFFKFIINKIVSFVKWVINKIFRKGKSKEEINYKMELFEELKDKPLFKASSNLGKEDYDDSKTVSGLSSSQRHLINICYLDADIITKINRLTGYSKAFVYSAIKIMEEDIKYDYVFMTEVKNGRSSGIITDHYKEIKQSHYKKKENYYHRILPLEAEYFGSMNAMAGIKFMGDNISVFKVYDKNSFFDNLDTNLPLKTRGGKQLTECIIANRDNIKTIDDLKKSKMDFTNITCGQICSKQFLYKMISLSDDIQKTYINESKEMTGMCKQMIDISKKYYNMIEKTEKELSEVNILNVDKSDLSYYKKIINAMKKRTLNSKTLITTIAQITQYSFSIRCTLLSITKLIEKSLDQNIKNQLKNIGKTNTLYGNITIGTINPNFDRIPDKFRYEIETLVKNYINTLISQHNFNQRIKFNGFKWKKDVDQVCSIIFDPDKSNIKGLDCYMLLSNDLKPYDKICKSMLKANIPYEVCIAGVCIHEATHVLQFSSINKKDNKLNYLGDLESNSGVKLNNSYQKGLRLSNDLKFDKKVTKKDKENIESGTRYYDTLVEKNANNVAYTFIADIINSFKISKAKKSYMLKITKKEFVHRIL